MAPMTTGDIFSYIMVHCTAIKFLLLEPMSSPITDDCSHHVTYETWLHNIFWGALTGVTWHHWWCKFNVEYPVSKSVKLKEVLAYCFASNFGNDWGLWFSPLCMYGMTSPSRESLVCALVIVAGDTQLKTETALVWTVRSGTSWNSGTFTLIFPSNVLLVPCASFVTANGVLVYPRIGLMMS